MEWNSCCCCVLWSIIVAHLVLFVWRLVCVCSVNYIITLTVTNGAVMTVEAEQSDTNERWTGEFTSHCGCFPGRVVF